MKAIILCEESQAVTIEMRLKDIEAYSCDLKDCSGGMKEWHIKDDALNNLTGYPFIGAHPVCQFLANSSVGWLVRKKPSKGFEWSDKYQIYMNWERYENMVKGAEFFNKMLEAVKNTGMGYVENPIMHKYAKEIITEPYTQIIQPYQFGHTESKATCLWIYGLPKLKETDNVKHIWEKLPKKEAQKLHHLPPGPERTKLRSKTFKGIAEAMAEQWEYAIKNKGCRTCMYIDLEVYEHVCKHCAQYDYNKWKPLQNQKIKTGFKDKNGKEICKGDLLEHSGVKKRVIWNDIKGLWQCKFDKGGGFVDSIEYFIERDCVIV